MNAKEIREELAELNPEALFADGLDKALIGIGQQFNRFLAVYDFRRVVAALKEKGMSEEQALEYIDFNVTGAWFAENTPIFLRTDL